MAENSKIEWTNHTFNPWIGCTKVSNGCKHCYAETLMDHRYKKVEWGPEGTRVRTSAANWRKPLQWNKQAAAEGRRYKVFCASLADVFEDRPELVEWRRELLDTIIRTPRLDWLILTKRPENVNRMIEEATGFSEASMWFHAAPHAWMGTSVEDQDAANKRIPHLLQIPARLRFLSMEPLLGEVNLYPASTMGRNYVYEMANPGELAPRRGIDWVIVGGESDTGARPMNPDWARSIRDQCQAAGVAFHFKQWGEHRWNYFDKPSEKAGWYPEKVGKRAAGRVLDGRTWDEFPK